MKIKITYVIGVGISVATSAITLAGKLFLTKYPGMGDFMLFYLTSAVTQSGGIRVLFVAKALFAALLFSLFYLLLRIREQVRFYVSLALTVITLIVMTFGEAVVG